VEIVPVGEHAHGTRTLAEAEADSAADWDEDRDG